MDDDEVLKLALDHAWNWFAKHAAQRMQLMNYLLLAISFILAAYGTTLSAKRPVVAGAIALLGAFVTLVFWRLDVRTIELQKAAEGALAKIESRLSQRARVSVEFVAPTRKSASRLARYRVLTRALAMTSAGTFLLGAAYAFLLVRG